MKLVVTGSLGHISKPLTQELVQKGHSVTVISSNPEKQKAIEALGAKAAIGTIENVDFLTAAFTGADAVYCMEPPVNFFDNSIDIFEFYRTIGNNYAQAILQSGVKHVVHLSSIGAHTNQDNGLLSFHYDVEQILQQLPPDIAITFMRPVGFYYNLFFFIQMIKMNGAMASNYYADYKEPWVSPIDIADAVAEEIANPFEGRKVRYLVSDEVTSDELAGILGEAIGKPDLKWAEIPDAALHNIYAGVGMSPQAVKGLVEMNASRRNGILYEDYFRNKPSSFGTVKLTDFAKEFAVVYNKQ